VGVPPGAAGRGVSVRSGGGSGGGLSGILGALGDGIEGSAAQLEHLGGRMSVQAAAALRNVLRFGITGAAAFLPNPHWQNLAALVGAVWDGVGSAVAVADGGFSLSGASLWAARLTTPFGLGFAGLFAWQAWAARRREDRIWYAAQAASSALAAAGAMTAGADLVAMGAATAEVPPLGAALMLAGVTVLAGACAYRERHLISAGVRGVWSGVTGAARAGAGWVGGKATRAAGAVVDAGRALADAVNPF